MRKILFLSLACLMALCAMAQIDAIRVTQNGTTDWYRFGESSRIDVTITNGNPMFPNKTYDLANGVVETAFGTDPLPPIKETAKNELETKKGDANHRMNQEAMGYDQIAEVQQAKDQGNEKVMLAADAAKIYIDQATNESTIQKEKENGLNAMEDETLKTLAGIQAAIAGYKEGKKNKINDIATNAKNTINELGVYYTVKDPAIIEIDKAVATAEASINNATSADDVNNAMNTAQNNINQQLANVQNYYNQLQAAKESAIAAIEQVAADAEVTINEAAEGYGNIETVQHVVATYQTQLGSTKDKAKSLINEETNLDGVGQLKEDNTKQINNIKDEAVEKIQIAIHEFIALQQNAIRDVEQVAATAKEEIDGLGVNEDAKQEGKEQIDIIVSAAKTTINEATNKNNIYEAQTQATIEIYNVVQNLKDTWITVRTDGAAGNWSTICLEKNITAIDGATFWTVVGQNNSQFALDQVLEPQAGYGYIIRFTAAELKVQYGNETAAEPVVATSGNPMQGTYVQIEADETNVLNGNYVVYNNQLCPVVSWVGLYAHRAYVVASLIPKEVPAPAPGRQRAYMPKPKETPTSLEANIESQQPKDGKYIINGQFVIVKDNKMYNAQGIEL